MKAATKTFDWQDDLGAILTEANGEWLTFAELSEALADRRDGKAARKADMLAVLGRWFDGGEIERDGSGRKDSPYSYRTP